MNINDLMSLGLGLTTPWKVVSSTLDVNTSPNKLELELSVDWGFIYQCPKYGKECKAHDFKEFKW